MTAISYHSSIKDVQAQPLALAGPQGRPEWFERVEATQRRVIYAVAEDASGAVVLPLCRNGRRLESLLDSDDVAWRPLATPYGSFDSLTIALAVDLAKQVSHIVIDRISDDDGTARQLVRAFERAGWLVSLEDRSLEDVTRRFRLQCWRKRDPRNWSAILKIRLRALVSRDARG